MNVTYRQTDRQDYYANTALQCTTVHRAVAHKIQSRVPSSYGKITFDYILQSP